jgi:hypothetical protein
LLRFSADFRRSRSSTTASLLYALQDQWLTSKSKPYEVLLRFASAVMYVATLVSAIESRLNVIRLAYRRNFVALQPQRFMGDWVSGSTSLLDGRTSDLVQAIQAHASNGNRQYPPAEANRVASNYNNLSTSDQQDLLNFLRSL